MKMKKMLGFVDFIFWKVDKSLLSMAVNCYS